MSTVHDDDDLLTAREAGAFVGVSRETIHFAVKNRSANPLPAVWLTVAGQPKPMLYVRRGDVLAWQAARPGWAKRLSDAAKTQPKEVTSAE